MTLSLDSLTLPAGKSVFAIDDPAAEPDQPVRVFAYRPERFAADSPILIVVHGYKRNADRYRDDWVEHAERLGALLLAPEFSQQAFPGPRAYEVGNMRTPDRRQFLPPERWSYGLIERLFDRARAATGSQRPGYWLYGHSAGGQFVHRLALFQADARFEVAIAANAGAYTLARPGERFPYGLDRFPDLEAVQEQGLPRSLVVMVGENDTDVTNAMLLRSEEAMRQGPHRHARGVYFYEDGRAEARRMMIPFGWQLQSVPGVGHSNRGMARAAAEWLVANAGARTHPQG
ncbi:MAG: alpha/beta hydrolase [Alphaproteobacteria bacterium]|nr:alpha/beta hydrolase [Alphaproteobacteria bacterium]MCB9930014.1 alpha/beta hydrolase [Alphaproteobacteria bacterium]